MIDNVSSIGPAPHVRGTLRVRKVRRSLSDVGQSSRLLGGSSVYSIFACVLA